MTTLVDRTPEQILDLLITAAGNGDVVRLAAVVKDGTTAELPEFDRALLEENWAQRWPHHLSMSPTQRPQARVSRSLPNLIGATVISGIDGESMTVVSQPMLDFLAERIYLADTQDRTRPANPRIPVGDATRAEAAALVAAATDPPDPPDPPQPQRPERPAHSGRPERPERNESASPSPATTPAP